MKKILAGILLAPTLLFAEPVTVDKSVVCEKTDIVLEVLQNDNLKEAPSWAGYDKKTRYALFVNEKTKTWTIIQFNNNFACILGEGEGSRYIFTGPKV